MVMIMMVLHRWYIIVKVNIILYINIMAPVDLRTCGRSSVGRLSWIAVFDALLYLPPR